MGLNFNENQRHRATYSESENECWIIFFLLFFKLLFSKGNTEAFKSLCIQAYSPKCCPVFWAAQSSRTLAVHVMTRPNLLPHPLHWGSALCPVHLSVSCKWTLGHGSPSHGAPGGRSCSSRRPRTASETRRREL